MLSGAAGVAEFVPDSIKRAFAIEPELGSTYLVASAARRRNGIAKIYGLKFSILRFNHKTDQAYAGWHSLPSSFYIDRNGKAVLEITDAGSKADIEG